MGCEPQESLGTKVWRASGSASVGAGARVGNEVGRQGPSGRQGLGGAGDGRPHPVVPRTQLRKGPEPGLGAGEGYGHGGNCWLRRPGSCPHGKGQALMPTGQQSSRYRVLALPLRAGLICALWAGSPPSTPGQSKGHHWPGGATWTAVMVTSLSDPRGPQGLPADTQLGVSLPEPMTAGAGSTARGQTAASCPPSYLAVLSVVCSSSLWTAWKVGRQAVTQ